MYDRDMFESMIQDYLADNWDEMEGLVVDEIAYEEVEAGKPEWVAYAHDDIAIYCLTDDGTANIVINYLGTR